jgi:hypothetical protein
MDNIQITGSHTEYFIPSVDFNAETGVCLLAGESYLEETEKFYYPLIDWIREFAAQKTKPLIFNFKLSYFNTSSSKCLVDLMTALKASESEGAQIITNWYYDPENEDYEEELEEVEDLIIETGLKVNMVPFKS